jgi:hypothetical protein
MGPGGISTVCAELGDISINRKTPARIKARILFID